MNQSLEDIPSTIQTLKSDSQDLLETVKANLDKISLADAKEWASELREIKGYLQGILMFLTMDNY